jgi:hypothetical protein
MSIESENIPEQHKGNHVDTVNEVTFSTRQHAQKLFDLARTRLLDMSNWTKIADGPSSEFELTDNLGNPIERLVQQGDKFKIDLPMTPGSSSGAGYDWVEIEHIQDEFDSAEDTEITSIRVRPTKNPKNDTGDIAHFFTDESTSTFLVKRRGVTVSAEVHGRNEVPNTHANNFWDTMRHVMVAMGAIFGFSKPQWKNLVDGLLDPDE